QNFNKFDPSVLREYDIRGFINDTLTANDAHAIGSIFGSVINKNDGHSVVVGRDGRHSSLEIEKNLIEGLISQGLKVFKIGLCPTPQLYFGVHHLRADGGIMITGSHNPPDYNGFKMMLGHGPFFGQDIKDMAKTPYDRTKIIEGGQQIQLDIQDAYLHRVLEGLRLDTKLSIVWDCGNGVAGPVIDKLSKSLSGEHEVLFADVDGNFPNHHPDPTIEKNLETLITRVKKRNADLGIAFDGDGDRIGVIDNLGKILWGDQLLAILAEDVLLEQPGSTIIGDVKASQGLFDRIAALGGKPLMWKTGHSLIKNKMKEVNAPLAGEMSGHIFFSDRYFGFDDAIYAAIRLIDVVNRQGKKLSTLRSALPSVINTPELRFPCEGKNKFSMIEQVKEILREYKDVEVCDIDGVRVSSKYGWWLIRASNTQEIIVARCEATSTEYLENIKAQLKEVLQRIHLPYSPF
ncbi:MAG: phosphomannomutase/phosphoglucomutase, partial [Pseudomonadota bacterium]|nr:phosphomannomutase/phosphoglucomutase [Pseudomonadota bacterium]